MTASKPNDIINLVEHTMDTWIKQLESDGLGSAVNATPVDQCSKTAYPKPEAPNPLPL